MDEQLSCGRRAVLKYAGAFIAWVIGSGFATGQEILQFFTSYGSWSYGVILINLAGFLFMGSTLMITGFDHRDSPSFSHFTYFCGKKLGTFYEWLIPVTMICVMPILISGAGATLSEYYGIPHFIGSALMAVMSLCAYLIGFERLVKVVSAIGPVIILFTLFVGTAATVQDFGGLSAVSDALPALRQSQSAPHWFLSAVLYLSMTFLGGSPYYTQLGRSAQHRKELQYGAVIGSAALIAAIAIMNTAILLNGSNTASLSIPVLFLARKISYGLGAVFSVVLILGMFSSCSAMMWSACSRFRWGGQRGNQLFACFVSALTFTLGLFSFSDLIGFLYPLVGYIGLIFLACVIKKVLSQRSLREEEHIPQHEKTSGR